MENEVGIGTTSSQVGIGSTVVQLYKVCEFTTTGWTLISPDDVNLTYGAAWSRMRAYIEEGYNPRRMKAFYMETDVTQRTLGRI